MDLATKSCWKTDILESILAPRNMFWSWESVFPVRFPKMFLIILFLTAVLLAVHPFYVLPSLDLHLFPVLPLDDFVSSLHCLFMHPSFTNFSLTLHLVGGGLEALSFTTSASPLAKLHAHLLSLDGSFLQFWDGHSDSFSSFLFLYSLFPQFKSVFLCAGY